MAAKGGSVWVPLIDVADLPEAGRATSAVAGGLDLCVARGTDGNLYCLANKAPPAGQPLAFGRNSDGLIADPVLGSKYNMKTGQAETWCTSLPGKVLGPLLSLAYPDEETRCVNTYQVRPKGAVLEVNVPKNAKGEFEEAYWTGILDARGKASGDYF
ncbi:unnamed protein product [Chrysoparadoxa australica]